MARLPQLEILAKKLSVKIASIADLIEYRANHDIMVQKVAEAVLPTNTAIFKMLGL